MSNEIDMTLHNMSLGEIYGAKTFLAPRRWEEASRWLPYDPVLIENSTAQCLVCAGTLPVIAHQGTLSNAGLSAIRDAGLKLADTVISYRTRQDYIAAVRMMIADDLRAIAPFGCPDDVISSESMWIDPKILELLNNKGNMEALVPATALPIRIKIDNSKLLRKLFWSIPLPAVIKVATDLPSGAGRGVFFLNKKRHIARAKRKLQGAGKLVVEEFLGVSRNYCLQYAILENGSVRYIGGSEQICDRKGVHEGNLIDSNAPLPGNAIELGRRIAKIGARVGYRGLAGFDIVTTQDERLLALDLNYRLVSSTAQVLLHDSLRKSRRFQVSRLADATYEGALVHALTSCRRFIETGWLVPLSFFDPLEAVVATKSRARLLILGENRAEIEARMQTLRERGMMVGSEPPRVCRRLQLLRDWSHDESEGIAEVFAGGARARRADGI